MWTAYSRENIKEKKTKWSTGSACDMVVLAKEIRQLDFERISCRYVSEHFDKYIILILAVDKKRWILRIVGNVIGKFREKTI